MPIPTPSDKESKEQFIPRCMSSEVMISEFPEQKQRFAVCNSKWENRKKSESAEADEGVNHAQEESRDSNTS